MNKKLLLVGVLALTPSITFGQNKSGKTSLLDAANQLAAQQLAGNNPAAPAAPAAPGTPAATPAATPSAATPGAATPGAAALTGTPAPAVPAGPDPSRVQDGGPLHIQINRVDPQGTIWYITGTLSSNEDTDIRLFRDFYGKGGGTSLGGNMGLRFTSVTLGDVPDHNAPVISAVSGTAYKFTLQLDTGDASTTALQDMRMTLQTKEGPSLVTFKSLKSDAPNDTATNGTPATPDGTAAVATAGGTDPNAAAAATGIPAAASSAASAVGAPAAPGTPAAGTAAPAAAKLAPAAVVASGPTAADKAAQADINAEAAALTAKHWNMARGDIAALQAIQRNGVKGTRLSPAMATAVNNAINNGLAQIAAAPKKK